ncbi:hypothetical protein RB195_011948 [Necator americanus]|uniref:Uncharacterized protein n=1 Tax=Necator americanus TaxID=51031 RepID=A0ABR1D4S0_NECAM
MFENRAEVLRSLGVLPTTGYTHAGYAPIMSRLSTSVFTFVSHRRLLWTSLLRKAEQTSGSQAGPSEEVVNFPGREHFPKDGETVMKIVQRFRKQPQEWPDEEQPFGIIERTFIGKMMHPVELRPERGFVNMVPFGFMMLRHFFRKVRAKGNFTLFNSTGIFNEKNVRAGAKRVFEVISQHACKDNMKELVTKKVCGEDLIRRFEAASCNMSERQRALLNLTEQDIYAIAPGVLGPFQLIRPVLRNKQPFISYSLLCCAFYKKQMLFDAVRDLPLLESGDKIEYIPIPTDYGYAAPRLIFAFITFGNQILSKGEVNQDVHLLDFQPVMVHVVVAHCSQLLNRCASRRAPQVCRQLSTHNTEEGEFSDIVSLAKVWNRAPLRSQDRYPKDQKAFSLTRDSSETTSKYQKGLCFREENNLVLTQYKGIDVWTKALAYLTWLKTKFFILGATPTLAMSDEDLVRGGQKVFRTILDAVVGRKVESLGPLMLRSSALDLHRKLVWNLKEKQRDALMVTDADFVGSNGFVYNWDGFGTERGTISRMIHSASIVPKDATGEVLDQPYFRYSIILAALLRKNELYKMVRQLSFNLEKERMFLQMPPNYGFITPRYVVMRIDMCHKVINAAPLQLSEDGLIYDFHIHSF